MPKEIIKGCGGQPPEGSATKESEDRVRASIAAALARVALTDADFIKEYCDKQRAVAQANIDSGKAFLDQQQADRDYVATYGTDEG